MQLIELSKFPTRLAVQRSKDFGVLLPDTTGRARR
jgi:hypothetical protein